MRVDFYLFWVHLFSWLSYISIKTVNQSNSRIKWTVINWCIKNFGVLWENRSIWKCGRSTLQSYTFQLLTNKHYKEKNFIYNLNFHIQSIFQNSLYVDEKDFEDRICNINKGIVYFSELVRYVNICNWNSKKIYWILFNMNIINIHINRNAVFFLNFHLQMITHDTSSREFTITLFF